MVPFHESLWMMTNPGMESLFLSWLVMSRLLGTSSIFCRDSLNMLHPAKILRNDPIWLMTNQQKTFSGNRTFVLFFLKIATFLLHSARSFIQTGLYKGVIAWKIYNFFFRLKLVIYPPWTKSKRYPTRICKFSWILLTKNVLGLPRLLINWHLVQTRKLCRHWDQSKWYKAWWPFQYFWDELKLWNFRKPVKKWLWLA